MAFHILAGILLFASAFAFPDYHERVTSNDAELTKLSARRSTARHPYQSPGWIPYGQSLDPQLSQEQTNGKGVLGTSKAPKLPHFLTDSSLAQGRHWNRRASKNSDFGSDLPDTGVTRHYDFTVSVQDIAPDGVTRSGMVVS